MTTDGLTESLLLKMRRDFPGFAERFFKIKTKSGKIVPFKLNVPQWIIWDEIKHDIWAGKPVRAIILKARQYGISTFTQALILWLVMTRQGQQAIIIGQNLEMAGNLFNKAELMYSMAPDWVKPERDMKSRGRKLGFGGKNQGVLFVETAENRDAGRSFTAQHVHATEIPFWPDPKRTMDGLLQSVPSDVFSTVLIESTAHGEGDWFHETWEGANDTENWNGFTPIFIPWFKHHEYRADPVKGFIFPDWILEIQKEHNLSIDQVTFYWKKYLEYRMDRETLAQEYPCNPQEAFKSSGMPFFNRQSIAYQRGTNEREPARTGMYVLRDKKPVWLDGDGNLHVWEQPVAGQSYTIGVDVATGRSSDFSVLQVLKGMEQVASFRGKVDADQLADLAVWVAKVYNGALIIPERNGVGEATLLRLVNFHHYGNVFNNYRMDTTTGIESKDYGFTMHKGNRMALLDEVNSLIREGTLIIRDDRTLREMERFVFTDETGKKAEAAPGSNDDMVMALALAVHASQYHSSAPPEIVYKDLEY